MEIGINKLILVDKGFIVEAVSPLNAGTTYYLNIKPASSGAVVRTYNLSKTSPIIIDTATLALEDTCFTLSDTPPCSTLQITFGVSP